MMLWIWFLIFGLAMLVGAGLGIWHLASKPSSSARQILEERLARGEVSIEEYRERLAVIGTRQISRAIAPLAAGLLAAGLIGLIAVTAFGAWHSFDRMGHMRGMMGGRNMGGMMGGMDGEPGRSGPPPASGAPDVRVAAFEFGFGPREVKVRAGETVNLVLDNRGMMFHTLTIGRLGFDLRTEGGRSIGGALTPPSPDDTSSSALSPDTRIRGCGPFS